MEPVAHFGLGQHPQIEWVEVHWLDGTKVSLEAPGPNQVLRVPYPARRGV